MQNGKLETVWAQREWTPALSVLQKGSLVLVTPVLTLWPTDLLQVCSLHNLGIQEHSGFRTLTFYKQSWAAQTSYATK